MYCDSYNMEILFTRPNIQYGLILEYHDKHSIWSICDLSSKRTIYLKYNHLRHRGYQVHFLVTREGLSGEGEGDHIMILFVGVGSVFPT